MATKRVQIDLAEQAFLRLQGLRDKTESGSYAEVVKNALRLYEALIDESSAGSRFMIQDKNGAIREYRIF